MNLICFPHYTCGGLLCDILSDKMSEVDTARNAINSFEHSIGKIGDSDSVFEDFDSELFLKKIENLDLSDKYYIGTHCWPGNLDIGNKFNKIICITTATYRSRVYRWARSYYNLYQNSPQWNLTDMQLVDKQRETAKNYIKPFKPVTGAINLEFSEIVENTLFFRQVVSGHDYLPNLERWKILNKFLYDNDFWTSIPVQRYHEAEYETALGQHYVYR
jgi:hypothetical protein